ncbi:MAG: aminopeptidase P N-terminal domain-containing protein [Propionibacteriaceae bacterium]|jgi:Xaa-Pro aminopeptidase|nr:aminopeptidase P N-terminal domain-containing protein [Propionibacteriaceae bacterium]
MNHPVTKAEPPSNRAVSFSEAFKQFIVQDWAPQPDVLPDPLPAAAWTPARRDRLRAQFPDERLVIPAGPYRVRSNDTDYRYRPHSAFAHLTGLGTDREPDAVLVIGARDEPDTLYFHPRVPRTDPEFYASSRYGEMWVGQRLAGPEMASLVELRVRDSQQLAADLAAPGVEPPARPALRVIRDADPAATALVDALRGQADPAADQALAVACSELRLVKDDFEVGELDAACAATLTGFEAVIAALPEAVRRGRGERWVEGVFGLHARHLGNAVGYDSIVAGGEHACTLHWIRNDGDLDPGDLLLLDAGVEVDSLYTADVTRTLPVSGRFTPDQREVYLAVLAAQSAGIAAARPGAPFADIHQAATQVIAQHLADWGLLPVSVDEALSKDGGQWRRWMVHGTSHHLGLDVHDCAAAREEQYRKGTLAPGMAVTVEPGLYFKSDDRLVPARFRGIGVRIEDDILITADGCRVLTAAFPRHPDAVETWIASVQGR